MNHPPTPRPPQALRDRRWERNRDLLIDEYPELLNPRRRIIWHELNRANTRYIARLFLWWLAVDYLVIGAATQLLDLWYFPGPVKIQVVTAKVATALLATWALNGVYLGLLALLTKLWDEPLICKWLTLGVPACFLPEYLVCFMLDSFIKGEDIIVIINQSYVMATLMVLTACIVLKFIILLLHLCVMILAKISNFIDAHFVN